ncbi:MAG: RICIN domain-containing protein, partial [Bacteroidales bacterium]|nr:RICIN domain-containing protein [Bacteroidales bacterium]
MKKTVLLMMLTALFLSSAAQHSAIKKISSSSKVKTGYYYIKCAADGKYLDVPGWRTEARKKDTHLQKYDLDNGWDRVIHVQRYRDGWCKLTPAHSPYVFDIEGGPGATQNGAKLQ